MPSSALNPGQAMVEFELVVPNHKPIPISSSHVIHMQSMAEDSIYGPGVYHHRFRTDNVDFLDNQVKAAMASSNPRIRFRLGVGVPNSTFWLPWQEHVITHYSAVLESIDSQAGHTIDMQTMDYMYLLTRSNLTLARKGTISQIVNSIATEFGLKQIVLESTTGVGTYVQSFQDSVKFIRERMICRARNDKGRGNYLFYFKDNTLHFHSPDYQCDVQNLVYFKANVPSLAMSDHSQRLIDAGVAGTTMTVYDPMTGKTTVIGSDPTKSLKYSDSVYNLSAIPNVNQNLFNHAGPGIPAESEIIAQNLYEHSRSNTFNLTLEVDKTIQIRHGDILNLVISPSDKKSSPWSGYYLVTSSKHMIRDGAVRSSYALARGEIKKSLTNLTSVREQDILVIEQEAPGQALNLGEIKSSQRTKGAGALASDGRLFSTVRSPNQG